MELKRITLSYPLSGQKRKLIFHALNLKFPPLGICAIAGDSGIGKSSLLKILARHLVPDAGIVIPQQSQQPSSSPTLMGEHLQLVKDWPILDWLLPEQIDQCLKVTNLTRHDLKKTFQQLSGGQKSRILLFIVLSQHAGFYLLDEPTRDLDLANRLWVIKYLQQVSQTRLCVVSTHDPLLIASAQQIVTIQSPYHVHSQSGIPLVKTTNNDPLPSRKLLIKKWKKWIHRRVKSNPLSSLLWLIGHITFVSAQFMLISLLTFHQHELGIHTRNLLGNFLMIQTKETIPIANSPFQIVSTVAPEFRQLQQAFSRFPALQILPNLAEYFPAFISVDNQNYQLQFIDLPYQDDGCYMAFIGGQPIAGAMITITTLPLPMDLPLTITLPMIISKSDKPLSWLDVPTIGLSYWQWYQYLRLTKPVDHHALSYLDLYQTLLPPTGWLLYHPDANQLRQLEAVIQSVSQWQVTNPHATQGLSQLPLLQASQFSLQFLLLWIQGLWLFIWWSRLHQAWFIHQQWLETFQSLHLSKPKVFTWLTSHLIFRWLMSQAIISGVLLWVMLSLQFFPSLSFWPGLILMMIGQLWFGSLLMLIRQGFAHA